MQWGHLTVNKCASSFLSIENLGLAVYPADSEIFKTVQTLPHILNEQDSFILESRDIYMWRNTTSKV